MSERLGDHVKFFFAESEAETIAGMIVHSYKDGVFYWGGCSLANALKYRPNNFLMWSAILWLKNNGFKWFEVGQFQPYSAVRTKEYTVGRYKSQFGCDYLVPFEGQKNYTMKSELLRCMQRIRQRVG